ncbi:hypothetical protein LINPERHAP1_LOCUS26595, partial [Linum perenne]
MPSFIPHCGCNLPCYIYQVNRPGNTPYRFYLGCQKPEAERCSMFMWCKLATTNDSDEAEHQINEIPISSTMPTDQKAITTTDLVDIAIERSSTVRREINAWLE